MEVASEVLPLMNLYPRHVVILNFNSNNGQLPKHSWISFGSEFPKETHPQCITLSFHFSISIYQKIATEESGCTYLQYSIL